MREATLYTKKTDKAVECSACAWRCRIAEGKTGVCGVRQNIGGKLFLLVYGRAVSANIDPIEKKPLYHFLPGEKIFSIGTIGCNFGCEFCQNFDISQASRAGGAEIDVVKSGDELSPEEAVNFCIEHRIPAIAFTYNEPAIFAEYAVEVMRLAKSHGIKGVFVSNGYETPEALDFLAPFIDAYNIDLKGFTEKYYQKICKTKLAPVIATIQEIFRRGVWLEITTLLVPGENDSEGELRNIAGFIRNISPNIPWHLSAFYPTYQMTDRPATAPESLTKAYQIGKEAGLRYVYTGNISDMEMSKTICPKCNEVLIERHGFSVQKNILEDNSCPYCREEISGVWR
ncbi:MAG: AmmeMemoRadiSam system radical SAM enzyme [Candidatus Magasanikbacteria bacterium]|nr:AmmeMemoRadiSam system radical SAM enzyme [Candidatus Magasanikbacteria bacterium]